jgi:hypothetical protein
LIPMAEKVTLMNDSSSFYLNIYNK